MPDSKNIREAFWETVPLVEMNDAEWEALCDGCGRCCMQKLEDEDSGQVFPTDVACVLLDTKTCRCTNYAKRQTVVPDCLNVRPLDADKLRWLPHSCAYKRLAEGRKLAEWHPLLSGDKSSVHAAGVGMAGRCISETYVPIQELARHMVDWGESGS